LAEEGLQGSARHFVGDVEGVDIGDVAGIASHGGGDDFFAIGGNSLLAIRMITRVREAFGVTPTMRSVFEAATLRAFSTHIESLAETSDASLAALLDELTGMSDEDAARLLDEGAGR